VTRTSRILIEKIFKAGSPKFEPVSSLHLDATMLSGQVAMMLSGQVAMMLSGQVAMMLSGQVATMLSGQVAMMLSGQAFWVAFFVVFVVFYQPLFQPPLRRVFCQLSQRSFVQLFLPNLSRLF